MTLAERLAQPDIADLSDAEAAEVLNTPDLANGIRHVDVDTSAVRGVLLASNEWPRIVLAAEGVGLPADEATAMQVRGLAILTRDTLTLTSTIETSVPARYAAIQQVLGGLVATGLIAASTQEVLTLFTEMPMTWAEAEGRGPVTSREVGLARGSE